VGWKSNQIDYRQGDADFDFNGRRTKMPSYGESRGDTFYVPIDIFINLTNGACSTNGYDRRDWDGDRDDRWNDQRGGPWRDREDWKGNNGRWNRDSVRLDGRWLDFDYREQPFTRGRELMVPFRAMGDRIGAGTDRSEDGRRVYARFGRNTIQYDKGHVWFRLNNQRINLPTVSEDRNGVLFVPVTIFVALTDGRVRPF